MRIYALCTASGTACVETALTDTEHANDAIRGATEEQFCGDSSCYPPSERPVAGDWHDVTDNDAFADMLAGS